MSKQRVVKPWEVQWTVNHLNALRVDGIWAVPRAGIIWTKTGDKELTLTEVMPFMAEMANIIMGAIPECDVKPRNAETLREIQQEEFFNIAARARAGGFTVKSAVEGIQEHEQEEKHQP